jgi:hypothetical protein
MDANKIKLTLAIIGVILLAVLLLRSGWVHTFIFGPDPAHLIIPR